MEAALERLAVERLEIQQVCELAEGGGRPHVIVGRSEVAPAVK